MAVSGCRWNGTGAQGSLRTAQLPHPITTLAILAGGVLLSLLLGNNGIAAEAPTQVNVILILADDLGYGDLGCYDHPKFKTPHLDQMAKDGARLTNFYAPMPYCAPTRASLMTGRYPPRCGLTSNPVPAADPGGNKKGDEIGLPVSEVTLGQAFQGAGYRTGCVGKWHLGHQPRFRPVRRGFDEYLGILYSNDMHRVELIDSDKVVEYPVVQATLTRRYTERALRFLEQNRDRPFFLYLPHAMPHKPLACSEAFYQKSGAGLYADVMAELDWSISQVLAKLKELKLEDRTLVLFTSDNGPWYGGSTGGLRGMKGQTWEGGLRAADRILAGQDSRRPRQPRARSHAGPICHGAHRRRHPAAEGPYLGRQRYHAPAHLEGKVAA
jgi:arylsulfatase A-like enzyme